MKNVYLLCILLFTVTISAQDFNKQWEKVIRYESQGKVRSAARVTEGIYKQARKQKNSGQLIKTFLYRSKYMLTLKEDAQNLILIDLRAEIAKADIPTAALLKVIYARCLAEYREANRQKIWRIKTTLSIAPANVHTWSHTNFDNEIANAYHFATEDIHVLLKTPLSYFEAILDIDKDSYPGTNSIYDFILKEKLSSITRSLQPIGPYLDPYVKVNHNLFAPTEQFLNVNTDSLVINRNPALKTLIEIEKVNPNGDNVLQRLVFIKKYVVYAPELYISALESLEKESSPANKITSRITLEKARHYAELADRNDHKDYNKKAILLLNDLIATDERTAISHEAGIIKNNILTKSLHFNLPEYLYSDENSRMLVTHRNMSGFRMRVHKVSETTLSKVDNNNRFQFFRQLDTQIPEVEKDLSLQTTDDYLEHTTEFLMPRLSYGTYVLSFSEIGTNDSLATTARHILRVTDLSILLTNSDRENFQVLHRQTGKPLQGARIQTRGYDITTNYRGFASLPAAKKYTDAQILVSKGSDTIVVGRRWANPRPEYLASEVNPSGHIQFYLDRPIYRPGQKVYYKGVLVQKYNSQIKVVPNTSVRMLVENSEYDEVLTIHATTNEFGSLTGSFDLPVNGMTGRYRITCEEPDDYEDDAVYDCEYDEHPFWDHVQFEETSISFSVEEYKRPRFEVNLEPITQDVILGQDTKIKGIVPAYDGSKISGAKVEYKISRRIVKSHGLYQTNDTIISSGSTITDSEGKFELGFNTGTPPNSDKNLLPVFHYLVTANVTDINGETHEASQTIKSGFHTIVPKVNFPQVISFNKNAGANLSATNLNGAKIKVKGELLIYYINPTNTKFKIRQWPPADYSDLSDEDFISLFPYEPLGKPEPTTGNLIKTIFVDTSKDENISLDFMNRYAPGSYRAVFKVVDQSGLEVEDVSYFELKNDGLPYDPSMLFTITQKNINPKSDGYVRLIIKSVIPDLSIQLSAQLQSRQFAAKDVTLYNHSATVDIAIPQEVSDSVYILGETVFENQFFNQSLTVNTVLPGSNLSFTTRSFRNKLIPGANETWSFDVKSVAGLSDFEILASMYDSSLDIFATDRWRPIEFTIAGGYGYTSTVLGIGKGSTSLQNLNPKPKSAVQNSTYPQLYFFGFDFNNRPVNPQLYKHQINKKARKPANAKMISGRVSNSALPVPGVLVRVQGTVRSTLTDIDGYYEIEAGSGEQLVFSMVGYTNRRITVEKRSHDVEIIEDDTHLRQVVVNTGYSVSLKKEQITPEARANAEIIQNLAGQISGLNIVSGSGQPGSDSTIVLRGVGSVSKSKDPLFIVDGIPVDEDAFRSIKQNDILSISVLKDAAATSLYGSRGGNGVIVITTNDSVREMAKIQPRKNLSETAFFLPELYTDSKGNFSFTFKSPEALTSWKLRMMAHDRNGISGVYEQTVITQKDIMLTPNMPRFFRENDSIEIQCKIANTTAEPKSGTAMLEFADAMTMENIDHLVTNTGNVRTFTIPPASSIMISWKIVIPKGVQGMHYKVVAQSGRYSDGEENIIPVLPNSLLITESIPLWVTKNSTKEFTHENLITNTSSTLKNYQLSLEYTSNPAWLAIQSLPYLMEYEHECAEQTFARFYANAVAGHIISSNSKISKLFKQWELNNKPGSPLNKNSELKSIILAETPWLKDAEDESILKKNMALLFDLRKLQVSQASTFKKLAGKQLAGGGFSWFDGGNANSYITRHIIAGLGKMQMMEVNLTDDIVPDDMINDGIEYMDHDFLLSIKSHGLDRIFLYDELHYLYSRSYFLESHPFPVENQTAVRYLTGRIEKDWLTYPLYKKAMTALVLERMGKHDTAMNILTNLKETSVTDQTMGMYWLENTASRFWYQSPIETQALIIEAFAEISNDKHTIDELKVWLIRNKQRNNWPTTRSTTEAIYALLQTGGDMLSVRENTLFTLGNQKINSKKLEEVEKEAETGYIRLKWDASEITSKMATLKIQNKSDVPGYGGFYWQYFEDLNKVGSTTNAPLMVSKQLFASETGNNNLMELKPGQALKIGQKITVRLTVTATEDSEYVHLKDMRASCLEPLFVKSEYKWEPGIGYYTSSRDAATHFFFDEIRKGTYIIEYDVRVNNNGDFSNGITSIQSMYAPEFSSHTEGIRVSVHE